MNHERLFLIAMNREQKIFFFIISQSNRVIHEITTVIYFVEIGEHGL